MENKAIFLPSFSQSWKYCFLFVRLAKTHPSGLGRYYMHIYILYMYLHLCFLSLGPFEIPTKIGPFKNLAFLAVTCAMPEKWSCFVSWFVFLNFLLLSFGLFCKTWTSHCGKRLCRFLQKFTRGVLRKNFPMFTVHCIGNPGVLFWPRKFHINLSTMLDPQKRIQKHWSLKLVDQPPSMCLWSLPDMLHPWKFTWIPKVMEVWKMMFLFCWVIFRFPC